MPMPAQPPTGGNTARVWPLPATLPSESSASIRIARGCPAVPSGGTATTIAGATSPTACATLVVAVSPGLRLPHHWSLAVVDLAFLASLRVDHHVRLGGLVCSQPRSIVCVAVVCVGCKTASAMGAARETVPSIAAEEVTFTNAPLTHRGRPCRPRSATAGLPSRRRTPSKRQNGGGTADIGELPLYRLPHRRVGGAVQAAQRPPATRSSLVSGPSPALRERRRRASASTALARGQVARQNHGEAAELCDHERHHEHEHR